MLTLNRSVGICIYSANWNTLYLAIRIFMCVNLSCHHTRVTRSKVAYFVNTLLFFVTIDLALLIVSIRSCVQLSCCLA